MRHLELILGERASLSVVGWNCSTSSESCCWPYLLLRNEAAEAVCLQRERSRVDLQRDAERTDGEKELPGFPTGSSFLVLLNS